MIPDLKQWESALKAGALVIVRFEKEESGTILEEKGQYWVVQLSDGTTVQVPKISNREKWNMSFGVFPP